MGHLDFGKRILFVRISARYPEICKEPAAATILYVRRQNRPAEYSTDSYGLTYNPNVKIAAFGLNNSPRTSEADMVFNVPVEKTINEHFAIDLGFTADVTNYQYPDSSAINNNLFLVSPAVVYHSDNIALHLEMTPSWDQGDFHLLPNFRAEYTTDDKRFTLFASLDGYYDKGSFKRFAGINPWLWASDQFAQYPGE